MAYIVLLFSCILLGITGFSFLCVTIFTYLDEVHALKKGKTKVENIKFSFIPFFIAILVSLLFIFCAYKIAHKVEMSEIIANQEQGFGSFTTSQLTSQRKANSKAGFGEITDVEVEKQRSANEALGLGRFTNAEVEQKKQEQAKIEEQNRAAQEKSIIDAKNQDKTLLLSTNSASEAKYKPVISDYLVKIKEPKLFVVAPMSYDTGNFPRENLPILDEAIMKFENYIDEMNGFSFIDRSKIAQIEKEHKFQLSDWSNDSKTAEIGKSLNANILLFLDKFSYTKGEIRFQAKFLDINTMQVSNLLLCYKEKVGKIEIITGKFDPKDFTQISTEKNPFADEMKLSSVKAFRIPQNLALKHTTPLGSYKKLDLSEYDEYEPKTPFLKLSSIEMDGFGSAEVKIGDEIEKGTYSFEPCEMYFEKIGNDFYTDGKIGSLSIHTDKIYEKFDVFTANNREFFIKVGTKELNCVINYYMQFVKSAVSEKPSEPVNIPASEEISEPVTQ